MSKTKKEKNTEFYASHKDYFKEYYAKHIAHINEQYTLRRNTFVFCDVCNKDVRLACARVHNKCKKHCANLMKKEERTAKCIDVSDVEL